MQKTVYSKIIKNDSTAVICFNKKKQMVSIKKWNAKDPMDIIDEIAEYLNGCKTIEGVLVESNSIGEVYYSALKRALNNKNILQKFTTSNTSKKEIIEKLIELLSRREITILDNEDLLWQMDNFILIELKAGNYTYGNSSDTIHDDLVMATAIACRLFSSNKGNYVIL